MTVPSTLAMPRNGDTSAAHPPLWCAPMAGLTHSAFRRLLSDFGACEALYTEMLSARSLPGENPALSPFLKHRPGQPPLVYQLLLSHADDIAPALRRLRPLSPAALDLNLGCPAPAIRKRGGGVALFGDFARLQRVLEELRAAWDGRLFVKCRLGAPDPRWRAAFMQRIRLFERCGVDCLVLHPRFSDEKLKRRARWEALDHIAAETALPIVGNGDIDSPERLRLLWQRHPFVRAFMIGRLAAVRPWIFAECAGAAPSIDPAEVWQRMLRYIEEDFAEPRRLGRLKEFTEFYSRNFAFGHELFRGVQSSTSIAQAVRRAVRFFQIPRELLNAPSIAAL